MDRQYLSDSAALKSMYANNQIWRQQDEHVSHISGVCSNTLQTLPVISVAWTLWTHELWYGCHHNEGQRKYKQNMSVRVASTCWQMLFREAFAMTSTQCLRKKSRPSISQHKSLSYVYPIDLILCQVWSNTHNYSITATCTCNYFPSFFPRAVLQFSMNNRLFLVRQCTICIRVPSQMFVALGKSRAIKQAVGLQYLTIANRGQLLRQLISNSKLWPQLTNPQLCRVSCRNFTSHPSNKRGHKRSARFKADTVGKFIKQKSSEKTHTALTVT